jgi:hypothetical protein
MPPSDRLDREPRWQRFALESGRGEVGFIQTTLGHVIGDIALLDDGSVTLGSRNFASRVEIINHHFGGCVANRGRGSKQLLVIDRADGESFHFAFQNHCWYRLAPATGQRSIFLQIMLEELQQLGPVTAFRCLRQLLGGLCALALSIALSFIVFLLVGLFIA